MRRFINLIIIGLLLAIPGYSCTRYWVGGGSSVNWNATANTNWGTASNTQNNASVPGVSDDVCFDGVGVGNSASTLSANIEIKSLDMTGYVNTLTHNTAINLTINGTLFTLASGMTYSPAAASSALIFTSTSGTTLITTNGKTVRNTTFNGNGGAFQLQDDYNTSTGAITLTAGNFNLNGKIVTASGTFSSTGSGTRSITATGASVLNLISSSSAVDFTNATNLTMDWSGGGLLRFTSVSNAARSITAGAGLTFGDITLLSNTNTFTFAGSSLGLRRLVVYMPTATPLAQTIKFTSGNTYTFSLPPLIFGINSVALTLSSVTGGSAATLSLNNGAPCISSASVQDLTVTGGANWYAENSTNVSGNTGWTFGTCQAAAAGSGGGSYAFAQ